MVIYKTINLLNGKYYIGKDAKNSKTYFGSGIIIKKAIKKYGKENFKKKILYQCEDLNELNKKEIEYVTEEVINDHMSYNLALGGRGGNFKRKGKKSHAKGKTYEEIYGEKRAKEEKLKRSQFGKKNGMFKRKHTKETRKKMSKSLQGLCKGKIVSKETREKLSLIFKNKTYNERFGEKKSKEIRKKQSESQKKRNRNYIIKQINNQGSIIGEFSTIKEAINKLKISRKKAYANTFKEFKFIKIKK
jgi:hypothetical protein